jgi:hypothetical protein
MEYHLTHTIPAFFHRGESPLPFRRIAARIFPAGFLITCGITVLGFSCEDTMVIPGKTRKKKIAPYCMGLVR